MYDAGYRGQYPYEIVDFISFKMSHKLPYRIGLKTFDRHFVTRMKQVNLDICHVHGPAFAGNIGIHYAKRKGIPVVGSFHTKFYDDILEVTKMKSVAKVGAKMVLEKVSTNRGTKNRILGLTMDSSRIKEDRPLLMTMG